MRKTLLIVLLISGFCFGQKYEGIDFYNNGKPKAIKTYKVSKNKIELIKKVLWHDNGQKEYEATFKDGYADGLVSEWYSDGQKSEERIYKDGEWNGLQTYWYKNGQKKYETTYKDGKKDGLYTEWYDNGQKYGEKTYKNGELISEECWDEDGNVEEFCDWYSN